MSIKFTVNAVYNRNCVNALIATSEDYRVYLPFKYTYYVHAINIKDCSYRLDQTGEDLTGLLLSESLGPYKGTNRKNYFIPEYIWN